METLEQLRSSIDTAQDLQSVVRTMKALAAISIRHYQEAVDALTEYHRSVQLGLQIAMRHRPPGAPLPRRAEEGRLAAAIIGSDQGMCGQFNEDIAQFAVTRLREMGSDPEDRVTLAVGLRVTFPLERARQPLDEIFSLPASLSGVDALVQDVVLKLDQWSRELDVERFLVFHNQPSSGTAYRPYYRQVLPVDPRWLQELGDMSWGGRSLPTFTVPWRTLFSSLIRQHVLVSVYRSIVESLAGENASRLASMQAAERNIDERLRDLRQRFHHERQSSITAELLDIVGGFEALRGAED